jgi:hypothetical protein
MMTRKHNQASTMNKKKKNLPIKQMQMSLQVMGARRVARLFQER